MPCAPVIGGYHTPWIVGGLSSWMQREAVSAGRLLRTAARANRNRQAVFRAHGWIIVMAAPFFGPWSVMATWKGAGQPSDDDRRFARVISAAAGGGGTGQERQGMTVWRWQGTV